MNLKAIKRLTVTFAVVFAVLLVVSFIPFIPQTTEVKDEATQEVTEVKKHVNFWTAVAVEENKDVDLDMLPGEVRTTSRLTTFYIFQPVERSGIQSIEVENEFGGYRVYRDATDTFQLEGFMGLSFNPETFSSLVVSAGTPTAMMRVAQGLDEAGKAEYGLDHPQASWTLTATDGKTYTVYVGDELLTEGGYYVEYADRPGAVYIVSTTIADTILQPAYKLLSPLLTAGLSTNTYMFVNEFTLWHGNDLFVNVRKKTPEEQSNPDAIVEAKLLYPRPEDRSNGDTYELNDDEYFQILYNLMTLEGEEVVAFVPTDEELAAHGLVMTEDDLPAYTIRYNFDLTDEETGATQSYEFTIFVSPLQPDGYYYAVSNLYGYTTLVKVGTDKLGWLEHDTFRWIFPTPFFENITTVSRITLSGPDVDADYRLTHGFAEDGTTPTLEVDEVKSGVHIPNAEVNNFRQYYKTMLNITNQEYATLTEEDRASLIGDDSRIRLTMTYENLAGEATEFRFYQYYSESTGHISGGKIFVVVNGVGEFYTTNDLVDKVVNDTSRVLDGLDVDAYGQN
ncbi:MAG: DUF4340 domain-containing protein [Ruminococcaceae bacterium]|jgi:hypothetical protein|nr:DUF4340 domain-containing protein [Oscillospiraceae bacterium]